MKKHLTIYLIISLTLVTQQASGNFGLQNIIEPNLQIIFSGIVTSDLNNDGFKDIIGSAELSGQVLYYLNMGDGTFGAGQLLMDSVIFPKSSASADFNNDGWQDIVSFSGASSSILAQLYLFSNTLGAFPTRVIIDSIEHSYTDVKVADIDNDGDEDLVVISDIGGLFVFYNDGASQFTKSVVDQGVITENYALALGDIDGDGFMEVIIGGSGTLIYKNAEGVLGYDSIRTDFLNNQFFNGLVFVVNLNDFDNDGDNDLLIGGFNRSDLRWHVNDGTGLFTLAQIFETNISQCESVVSKDLDNDGDIDILTTFPQTGQVVWYENNGSGTFGPLNLVHQGEVPFTEVVYSDDLNNDGLNDSIWSRQLSFSLNNNTIDVLFNNGFE